MYRIIKTQRINEVGVEARLAEIDSGFSVGTFDLDCQEYYPEFRIFPKTLDDAEEKAKNYFEKYIKHSKVHVTL